jgi:hypothetical protein
MVKKFPTALVVFFGLSILAGVIFTWPLAIHFFSSIPYTLRPIAGFEKVPLMPGDHLQTYYWFWLMGDNLFGGSSLFSNPYEFNGPLGPMSSVFANFPFSLLYVALLPLGPLGAYNGLIFLSFFLSGWAVYLLARLWTRDFGASLLAGLIFAVVPYRVSHIAGGQLYGYVIFFLPLCLYFIEKTLIKGRWRDSLAAGACLILLSWMDPHTSYLAALTLGLYLPSRVLLEEPFPLVRNDAEKIRGSGIFGTLVGGVSFSLFLWMFLGKKAGLPFWHRQIFQPLFLGTLTVLLSWLYLSALTARMTILSFADARRIIGRGFYLFLPLWLYGLRYALEIPRLGLASAVVSFGTFFVFILIQLYRNWDRLMAFNRSGVLKTVIGVGMGLALASAYLMHMRKTVFLPSLAGKGRSIHEVLLFSPQAGNLFFWQDINLERFVFLGWGLLFLAFLGMASLLGRKPENRGKKAIAGLLGFIALLLTLGPTLPYFPLYQVLYAYFPFFNYPRVPGRFVMVGILFLCLLAAAAFSEIREWLNLRGRKGLRKISLLVIPLILVEYLSWRPLGLSEMTGYDPMYDTIRNRLAHGRVLLELPIWPGDSHQSSAYEYAVTRTRKPMINGYAPVVFRDYIKEVFWPLFPLDLGELKKVQQEALQRNKVDLVTFHDNALIYSEKISPFPPRLVLKRLMASPHLKEVFREGDMTLFQFKPTVPFNPGVQDKFPATSPVQAVFFMNGLTGETGRAQQDSSASGYYLLMDEKGLEEGKLVLRSGGRGNVIGAVPGRDRSGYLTLGTHRYFPAGTYRAQFRLKGGPMDPDQEIGRIEIIEDRKETLAQKILRGSDFTDSNNWIDIPINFDLPNTKEIGFRVFFTGKGPLAVNVVRIAFSDQESGPGSVEAEDLLRQTGTVVSDPAASGKEAVLAKAGFHPPVYLCYGPYRTFESGNYRAHFFIRSQGDPKILSNKGAALLEVATDMGKRVFLKKIVPLKDLAQETYRPVDLDFKVPFRCELGFRVKFLDQADLWVDKISVEALK